MAYIEVENDEFGFLSVSDLKEKGEEKREAYNSASPFPHIVIDDFLSPSVLDQCLADFPADPDPDSTEFNRAQEKLKSSYHPDYLAPHLRSLFYSLNSRPFLRFLENLTGITGLIPDPYFTGGGFHQIRQGGHLDVHADFNHNRKLDLERRINVLVYLNKNWSPDYGGQLELWDNDMKECIHSVVPEFNRCVIFNTTSTSNHGNPNPINHPNNVPRRSIALYYYTATWDDMKKEHSTRFRSRPNTGDQTDWNMRIREVMDDIMPPVLNRKLMSIKHRLRSGTH